MAAEGIFIAFTSAHIGGALASGHNKSPRLMGAGGAGANPMVQKDNQWQQPTQLL